MAKSNAERSRDYRERHPEKVAETQRQWRERNPDYYKRWNSENPERVAGYARANTAKIKATCPERLLLNSAKRRAKERGLPFSITVSDIPIPEKCPYLGIALSSGERKMHDASPSVDRINPHLGYVPGNVQVISYKANSMKRNCTMEELLMFAETVLSKHKITDAVPGEKHNV